MNLPTTDSLNAISSPASEAGPTHSNSQAGQIMSRCGQEVAPASHSALEICPRKKPKDSTTSAIFGLYGKGSLKSAALQSSLASKLQTRFASGGWTSLPQIWRNPTTPSGRQYCQLAATVRTMRGKDFSGSPTPAARDGLDVSSSGGFLAARLRHSPSIATRLLTRGAPWPVISLIYCLAMGYPSLWHETRLGAMATQSSLKSRRNLSRAGRKL